MLNSFWRIYSAGYHAPNVVSAQVKNLYDLCGSKAVEIHDTHSDNPKCMIITMAVCDEYNEGNFRSHVIVSSTTISAVTVKMSNMMEVLSEQLLHYDTDSAIFIQKLGQWKPRKRYISQDWDNRKKKADLTLYLLFFCGPMVFRYEN